MVAIIVWHRVKIVLALLLLVLLAVLPSNATPARASISLSTITPYTQNFDSLLTSAAAAVPTDWRVSKNANLRTVDSFSSALTNTEQVGGNNLSATATNGIYNFGAGNWDVATDRAVGFLSSSSATKSGNLYAYFNNGTGFTLSSVIVSYSVEKYRKGTNSSSGTGPGFRMQMYYSLDGTNWTPAGSDFLTSFPADSTTGGYTSAPGETVLVSDKTLAVQIPSGSDFYLAWNYSVTSGTYTSYAQALAVDDFSILGVPDTTPPTVASTNPSNSASDVATNANVVVNFSEPVSVATNSFTLSCTTSGSHTFALSGSGSSYTLNPDADFTSGETCTGTVVSANVIDLASLQMASDYTWSFTIVTVDYPPTVTSTTPTNGSTGIAAGATVTVTFSENVDLTASAVTLECPAGSPVAFGGLPATNVSSVTLTPSTSLPLGTLCTGKVVAGQVTDGDGTPDPMASDYIWSFTTVLPSLSINNASLNEGNSSTSTKDLTVTLSASVPYSITFDIATADNTATATDNDYIANSLTSQIITAGNTTYTFSITANGDTKFEPNETFYVNVTNVTGATVADGQGLVTLVNDDLGKIHDVQGSSTSSPYSGSTVIVEGVVTADYQGTNLKGFFLQEENADADADPLTSEGIFVFCNTCPTAVAEGQRVQATGSVSEYFNMTQITASTAGSVVVTDAGNHLADVTPTSVALPVVGDINAFYEEREGMLVSFSDTLTVSEYFELARYGQIVLYQGGRPYQFTESSAPSVSGNAAYADTLARRRVILDDDNNLQEAYLSQADGSQSVYYPHANGGFSTGTQGSDYFRGGDLVSGLTGVLHWSYAGLSGTDAWRIRPTASHPVTFTATNSRPASPPVVGGSIKAVSMNLLNYFTTIDSTSSSSSGPCGPSANQDCRGADSAAELVRQRERASIVICSLNADVYGLMEVENTTDVDAIGDLLGAVNARCGGSKPFAAVNTGGTLGTDAIRVSIIYRTGTLSPVGSPLVDLDPIHNRPPTAQTFDVVDAENPAHGERFTVIANHLKSKGCSSATGANSDAGDGQGCYAYSRTQQAARLLIWISSVVLPAADDSDVLLLGDFNSYAQETPITTLTAGGFTDLATSLLGSTSYSYLFDGQLGHLDYAFASASLAAKIDSIGNWHINADEVDLFDYDDGIKDVGEAAYEEKPDGSALVPPRVVFETASPYRASDHDPVLVGLFRINAAPTLSAISPTSAQAGALGFTLTLTGTDFVNGSIVRWEGTDLPTTFVSGTKLTASVPASLLLNVGTYNVTVFNPTPGGGTSASKTFSVVQTATSLALTVSSTSILPMQPVTLTATLTQLYGSTGASTRRPRDVTPTGTITFTIDGSTNITRSVGTNGVTTLSLLMAGVGTHSVTAHYSGEANLGGSTSNTVTVVVSPFKFFLPSIKRSSLDMPNVSISAITAMLRSILLKDKNAKVVWTMDEFWLDLRHNTASIRSKGNRT